MPRASRDTCVLDTHAWLFATAAEPERLGRAARRILEGAGVAWIPAICQWEVAMLVERGRVRLDRPLADWLATASSTAPFALQPLTPEIASTSAELGAEGFHPEPADRLIYATAAVLDAPLLTADRRMSEFDRASRRRSSLAVWD